MDSKELSTKPICLKTILGYEFYEYEEIIMFRANHNYSDVFIIDNNKPVKALYNLCTIERIFKSDSFFRCHKSYIINLKHVHRFKISERTLELRSGIIIPISKNKIKKFKELFLNTQ